MPWVRRSARLGTPALAKVAEGQVKAGDTVITTA
jgi:hypothetical protein